MRADAERYKHILLNDDNSKYVCKLCTPRPTSTDWRNTNARASNINQHLEAKAHTDRARKGQSSTLPAAFFKRPELTQDRFDDKLVKAVVSCNLPFAIVENDDFRHLLLDCPDRKDLRVMSRKTLAGRVRGVYDDVFAKVVAQVDGVKMHITFDLWSDPSGRGWLGVNGHFFNNAGALVNVLLVFKYVPKSLEEPRHTGEHIADVLRLELTNILGENGVNNVWSAVVDGGSNVTKASRLLLGAAKSRRCAQHALQTVLKYMVATLRSVALAIGAANYMAMRSKTSQHFAQLVGRFSTGTKTRWNSFIRLAEQIYNARVKLAQYNLNEDRESAKFDEQYNVLHADGFKTLHDFCLLVAPLMDITIDEEGERYITSSSIIPRMHSAVDKIDGLFALNSQAVPGGGFQRPREVARWQQHFQHLSTTYLKPFFDDEMFLVATMLDRRQGVETLPAHLAMAAAAALRTRLTAVHAIMTAEHADVVHRWQLDQAELLRLQHEQQGDVQPVEGALNEHVANARQAQVRLHVHDDALMDALFGGNDDIQMQHADGGAAAGGGARGQLRPPTPMFRTVADELIALRSLPRLAANADAMSYYSLDSPYKLLLARRVAMEVLSVPAGEAAVERDFSIAAAVIGKSRRSLAPTQLERLVFAKRNTRALNL
jgi:hypothetical protein